MEADIRELVGLMVKSSGEGCPKHVEAVWEEKPILVAVVKGDDVAVVKAFLKGLEQ